MIDSTIIASLISAGASIIVAFISKKDGSPRISEQVTTQRRNRRIWITTVCILVAWMTFAALFLHWDLAGVTSTLAVPLVTWILAASFPIQPGKAAAVPLFLFPFAFLAEPIGKWRRGIEFQNHFAPSTVTIFIGIGFATALIAWLIARWRMRSLLTNHEAEQSPSISSPIGKELLELADLHKAGVLTDQEFARAKDKLLSR